MNVDYKDFSVEDAMNIFLSNGGQTEEETYEYIIDDIKESAGNGKVTLVSLFEENHSYKYEDITPEIIKRLESKGFVVEVNETNLVVDYSGF